MLIFIHGILFLNYCVHDVLRSCFNKRNEESSRDEYFDQKLYDERYSIERTSAWIVLEHC